MLGQAGLYMPCYWEELPLLEGILFGIRQLALKELPDTKTTKVSQPKTWPMESS